MSKQKYVLRMVMRQGAISSGIVLFFAGLYAGSSYLSEQALQLKTDAENNANRDQGKIAELHSQLDKSSVAEKRFIEINQGRNNADYSPNTELLTNWMRSAKVMYRLSQSFKLTLAIGKRTDNLELLRHNYEILIHDGMSISFDAMSDQHVFSFLESMLKESPGFIRINKFSIQRKSDIDRAILEQMRAGYAPLTTETKIEFNWITVSDKKAPPAAEGKAGS